jgi:hypothetical protein
MILEDDLAPGRHTKAQRRRNPLRAFRLALFRRQPRASARIARWPTGGLLHLARDTKFLRRAETGISVVVRLQGLEILCVDGRALGLQIGGGGTTGLGAFLPVQTQPAQIGHQSGGEFRTTAFGVGVLDAQHEQTIQAPRQQRIEQCRAQIAEMQFARRARCKAGLEGRLIHGAAMVTESLWGTKMSGTNEGLPSGSGSVLPFGSRPARNLFGQGKIQSAVSFSAGCYIMAPP